MGEENNMKLFLRFIYQYRFTALLFLLFMIIGAGVLFLYDTCYEAVFYAGALCVAVGAAAVCIGFYHFRNRHMLLRDVYRNLPLMTETIPEPDNLMQEDLQKIIVKLSSIYNAETAGMKNRQQEQMEYYTVWVHQIKTPISAMQMILQSEDTRENRELLAELFKIEQYVEMALCYLRLDSNSNDLIIKEYDLDSILRKAVHHYAPMFIRRRIGLIYTPVHARAVTDEKWLLFIVEQLLSNAVKYTVKGSVTIRYADEVLTVSDTGIGISEEDIPRIFEKGYTGLTGRQDTKSTGIGLYLCKRTAQMLGHRLTASSEVGKGSDFSIHLHRDKLYFE